MDRTEDIRKHMVGIINSEVQSLNKDSERERLEKKYKKVWNTEEMTNDFSVEGFMSPFVVVKRKSDNKKGVLEFQDNPRFYFLFEEK